MAHGERRPALWLDEDREPIDQERLAVKIREMAPQRRLDSLGILARHAAVSERWKRKAPNT